MFCLLGKEGLGLLGEEWKIPILTEQELWLGTVAVTSSHLPSFYMMPSQKLHLGTMCRPTTTVGLDWCASISQGLQCLLQHPGCKRNSSFIGGGEERDGNSEHAQRPMPQLLSWWESAMLWWMRGPNPT